MSLHDSRSIQSYVIQERIAGGGMGYIYKAIKKGIGGFEKQVVLKQLLPELTQDPDLVQLFFREAQIHAVLDHANIVHIIDLVGDGKDYYIVMEYVRGTDLYYLLRKMGEIQRRMPLQAALFIGREMLKGLDYAHGKKDESGKNLGIVHRDVSPTNVMISGAGEVKITDFGIARAEAYSTNLFQIRGKVAYMSPEQAVGEDPDCRSDVYSSAVCIYEMIAGRRPLPSPKKGMGAVAHYSQHIKPLASIRSSIPAMLDEVILWALSINFRKRPGSAREFLAGLEDVVVHENLHYTQMTLAHMLKGLFGNDPEKWAESAKTMDSKVCSKSSKDTAGEKAGKRRRNMGGFESGSPLEMKRNEKRSKSWKGKEITSVKISMLPSANNAGKRVSPRLPPPKRSVFDMIADDSEVSPVQVCKTTGDDLSQQADDAGYELPQKPVVDIQTQRRLEETYSVVQSLGSEIDASEKGYSFSEYLLWSVFILGLGLVGFFVFLFVVWFASWG